ncbi:hypothetical protein LUX32_08690 [Actinomadura madurae]|nr:hypothetical protein [Actinomadura madurae]MCP9977710.1 hypothetical protein [Actinomadura madurae]
MNSAASRSWVSASSVPEVWAAASIARSCACFSSTDCTPGCRSTMRRKSAASITSASTASSAMTVADQASPSNRARSPMRSPGPRTATIRSSPARSTRTFVQPVRMTTT